MISQWVVNSINHPEFKRTFVTSFLHPFFNSITFIPTYIATFLNLFLINLCCPSPTSCSIIFNLPPSPPPLSLLFDLLCLVSTSGSSSLDSNLDSSLAGGTRVEISPFYQLRITYSKTVHTSYETQPYNRTEAEYSVSSPIFPLIVVRTSRIGDISTDVLDQRSSVRI